MLPKNILVEYTIGTHGKIRLRMFKPHQRLEIQNLIKEIGQSNNILIEDKY